MSDNIKDSELVCSFGFKKRTRNKVKQIYNEKYDIVLIKNKNDIYEDQNGELYETFSDACRIHGILSINESSQKFHNGELKLDYKYSDVFKSEKCIGEGFLTQEKTLQLLEAEFNKMTCEFSLHFETLTEVYYTYDTDDSRKPITTLKLHFITEHMYSDDKSDYSTTIYDFWDLQYPVSSKHSAFVPIDFIIEKFL